MKKLFLHILGGIISFFLAVKFLSGVDFKGEFIYLVIAGAFLGLINFFIKPIIKIATLPLRILTLGLFGIVINITIIWLISLAFPEIVINGFIPLLKLTLIVWLVGFLLKIKK